MMAQSGGARPTDTILGLLREASTTYADRTALVYYGSGGSPRRWSYRELATRSRRVAAWLRKQGVQPGDRVILCSPNCPAWVAAFFGILGAGAVVVPLDVRSSPDFVERVHHKTRPALRFVGEIDTGRSGADIPTYQLAELDSLIAEVDPLPWEAMTVDPDDLAELVFTSGTTGTPKGVMLSQGNIASNVRDAARAAPRLAEYRLLSVLPLSHMFEQTGGLLTGLSLGATTIYVGTLQPNRLFQTMQAEKVTVMCVMPLVLQLFLRGIEREVEQLGKQRAWHILHTVAARAPRPLQRLLFRSLHQKLGGHLQAFICGGAYLDWALAEQWENTGIRVYQGYGTTEAAPVISTNTDSDRRTGSVGKPLPSVQVRIAEDGEILVKGPNVTRGYWEHEAATAAAFDGTWYRTGDLGCVDRAGFLYLKGRKKNLIVLPNGLNVYPEDVENVLLKQPGVRDAIVLGLDRRGGETEVFAVLLLEGTGNAPAIVKAANAQLAVHQRIRGHWVWPDDDFPRTHTLKVKLPEIEQRVTETLQATIGR